jgi:hypothetical protein
MMEFEYAFWEHVQERATQVQGSLGFFFWTSPSLDN